MFAWTSHGTELKRFLRHRITRAAVAVMLLIPLLYGAMYVWAFWDPTAGLDRLPVALVNEDQPTTVNGERLAAGEKTVDALLEAKPFEWHQTTAQEARDGVQKGTYYFAVSVPASYSQDIASLAGDQPRSAHIDVTYNDSNSFLASTLGRSAMIQVKEAVNNVSGTEAVDRLLIGLGQARDGLGTASDGAFRLKDGLTKASDGSAQLNVAAGQLRDGSAQLADGNQALADGTHRLATEVAPMAGKVGQLSSGSAQLTAGLDALQSHLPQLTNGVAQLDTAQRRYLDGVSRAGAGAHQLSQSVNAATGAPGAQAGNAATAQAGSALDAARAAVARLAGATGPDGTLYGGAAGVANGAAGVHTSVGNLSTQLAPGGSLATALKSDDPAVRAAATDQLLAAVRSLDGASGQVATGAANVRDGIYRPGARADASTLHGALTALQGAAAGSGAGGSSAGSATGLAALQAGLASLDDAFNNPDPNKGLIAGAKALNQGTAALSTGAQNMAAGVTALDKGAHQLNDGVRSASGSIPALVDGVSRLDTGAQQAAAGAATLRDGNAALAAKTPQLADGLSTAQKGAGELASKLHDGAQQIPQDPETTRGERAAAMNSPVDLSEEHLHQARSWGEGFSPFFIGIALWVGCLITWLLLRPLQTRALMTSVSGFRMAWGALNSALLLAMGQVFIMLTVMHFAIGLDPSHVVATIAFTTLCAFAFMAMQQAFQVMLGSAVGKVAVIALLMVQLASSGGTYPIETEPGLLRALNPYLPMTYLVSGLRSAITGELDARFWTATLIMGVVFLVSLAVSSVFSARKRTWTMSRLHPALSI